VSAVKNGLAMNIWDAINNRVLDNSYRLDFGKLHTFAACQRRPETVSRLAV
jgi:hypothetical protein